MRFGQSAEEAAASQQESSGHWMRYMKDGDTTFRVIQEPEEWTYFWEHFNPGGFSFPCTNDRKTCPGCTSDVEKMKKASRKVAFNVLQGEYVNVYKVPPLLADKLKMRKERLGTITDREYTITRYKTGGDKTEYDVEGQTPTPIDLSKLEPIEIEPMLAESYQQAWGDSNLASATRSTASEKQAEEKLRAKVDKATNGFLVTEQPDSPAAIQTEDPPSEPSAKTNPQAEGQGTVEVTEEYLLGLDFADLQKFCADQGVSLPPEITETAPAVTWLKTQQ